MNQIALNRTHREAPAARRWRGPIRSYACMMSAWLLDFRAESEGAGLAIQIFFFAAYLFSFVLFIVADRANTLRIQGLWSFVFVTSLFLLVGTISGLAHDQGFYPVFRNSFSVFVFITAAYATARVVLAVDIGMLRTVLGVLCFAYSFSSMIILYLTEGGIEFATVRFQILGASAIPALGFAALILPLRTKPLEVGALLGSAAIVFLSVTRTFILVVIAQSAPLLRHLWRQLGARSFVYLGGLILILLIGETLFGAGLLRWISRLGSDASSGGGDVTFQTRWSEWTFMYDATVGSLDRLLFGNGMAARTIYMIPKEIGGGYEWSRGFGHNQYVSILFIAGIIGGLPYLVVSIAQLWRAVRFLNGVMRHGRSNSDVLFLGAWGATIVIGYMVANIFQSSLGSRGPTLWYAIGVGLLLGVQALFDPVNVPPKRAGLPAGRHAIPG